MSVELDPLFLRGLRLLHSRARDSADQLHQLLDEVLAQKHGGPPVTPNVITISRPEKSIASIKQENDVKYSISKKVSPKHVSSEFQSSKSCYDEPKRKEAEKRQFERLKQELSDLQSFESKFDLQQQQQHCKRARLDSPHSSSLSSSPSPQPLVTVIKTETYSEPSTSSTYQEMADSGTSDDTTDAEGFALQMGLTCIICKLLDVSSRNQLIECQDCHNLYHQECHRPPVTEQEINDPRHVWYCTKCTKTMKKVTTKAPPKPSKPILPSIPPAPNRETFSSTKITKSEVPTLSLLPFKRTEVKTPMVQSSSISTSANKPTGLASLAANMVARPSIPATSQMPVAHPASSKSGFGPTKTTTNTSMLASKSSLAFPSLSSLSTKPSSSLPTSVSPAKSGNPLSGLASLANAAAVVSKSSALSSSSTSSKHSSISSITSSTRSCSTPIVPSIGSNNGGNGGAASSVGSKTSASSSLMSADKRLQIMKKKAAAKMQEKRRLSTK